MNVPVWSLVECPGCFTPVTVGLMSLCATCKHCGMYYADVPNGRGWYASRAAYERGDARVAEWVPQ